MESDHLRVEIFNRSFPALYLLSRDRLLEKRHQRTADRKILVSPFIHPRAQELGQELGIENYGDSTDVELELS